MFNQLWYYTGYLCEYNIIHWVGILPIHTQVKLVLLFNCLFTTSTLIYYV